MENELHFCPADEGMEVRVIAEGKSIDFSLSFHSIKFIRDAFSTYLEETKNKQESLKVKRK